MADETQLLDAMEELVALAKKGKRYDSMLRDLSNQINTLKKDAKTKWRENNESFRKVYQENIQLKSTHPDWIGEMCKDCNGDGGFDCGDHSEACHCENGTIYTKKEGK